MQLNVLPCDGAALFMPDFIARSEAEQLLQYLQSTIPWREETLTIYGKTHLSPRLVCWFGDHAYSYSGTRHNPVPWLPELLDLKQRAEIASGAKFNSVLANLYRDGRDSVGWHADDERNMGEVIASVSLGAARNFRMRHKARKVPSLGVTLTSGSLLVMGEGMQQYWEHAIPKTAKPVGPRINLTFRWLKI